MKKEILEWLCATGTPPPTLDETSKEEAVEFFTKYYDLKIEELIEQRDALIAGDLVEYLDGVLDEQVYLTQELICLQHLGFDTNKAMSAVLLNNQMKYTTNVEHIMKQHALLVQEQGENNWYVDSNWFDGQMYHCIKNYDTHKVTKFVDHVKPTISEFVPKKFRGE